MSDTTKIMSTHLRRVAYVYVRQSSVMQIERVPSGRTKIS